MKLNNIRYKYVKERKKEDADTHISRQTIQTQNETTGYYTWEINHVFSICLTKSKEKSWQHHYLVYFWEYTVFTMITPSHTTQTTFKSFPSIINNPFLTYKFEKCCQLLIHCFNNHHNLNWLFLILIAFKDNLWHFSP